jgi:hypothetical protein
MDIKYMCSFLRINKCQLPDKYMASGQQEPSLPTTAGRQSSNNPNKTGNYF